MTESDDSLNEELKRVNKDLAILYDISNAMRTRLDLKHILYAILTGVTAHTGLGFNRAILFLVNAADRCLEPKMAIGPESGEHAQRIWKHVTESSHNINDLIDGSDTPPDTQHSPLFQSIQDIKIPLGGTETTNLLLKAYVDGHAVHITRDKIHEYHHDVLLQRFHTNELVIMPLKAKDKVNGIIVADNLYTQKTITEKDLKTFTMLANQAGLAIENSHLYELIKHRSHTDSLTDLWNHGFFQDQLNKELTESSATGSPVTLLLIDIDNFKILNDLHGHRTGDHILKVIARILKNCSRENDFACRYGGEEFSVILTNTPLDQGYAIAERVRQSIEDHDYSRIFRDPAEMKITVSVGVSSFPAHASNKEDLIARADKAMYIAKFSGKNQTCLSDPAD